MKELITITIKHWKSLVAITTLTLISCVIFGVYFTKTSYDTTVFMNVGAKTAEGVSPLDTVQSADSFTETIQGWFKNPYINSRIAEESGFVTSLNARKQEKQNIVVTFKTQTEEQARKISQSMEKQIKDEITKYNTETGSGFVITDFTGSTEQNNVNIFFFVLLGFAGGVVLAYILLLLLDSIKKALHS